MLCSFQTPTILDIPLCPPACIRPAPRQHEHQRHQQRRCAAVVGDGHGQRPLQQDVGQSAGELQGDQRQQHEGGPGQRRAAAGAQAEPSQVGDNDDGEHAVGPVDGDQCVMAEEGAAGGFAEGAPQREAMPEVHSRDQLAVA